MKKIIDGRMYNTETAKCVGEWSNAGTWRDFNHMEEALYRKKNGDDVHDFDTAKVQCVEHPVKRQGVGGGVHHIMSRNGGGGDEEQGHHHQHGHVAANADNGG